MITKIENEHGLCIDHLNNVKCVYADSGSRCKKPDYERCMDINSGKSYIFIKVKDNDQ